MTRRDVMLAIMAAADGQAFTPVQIQKAAFLVTQNLPGLLNEGAPFNFTPYDYGPFDAAVYAVAEELQALGLAQVNQTSGRWRTYAANEMGVDAGRRILGQLPEGHAEYVRRVSTWVRSMDFATLVRSIYEAYPDMRRNSVFQG
jgi:hypothetical protein